MNKSKPSKPRTSKRLIVGGSIVILILGSLLLLRYRAGVVATDLAHKAQTAAAKGDFDTAITDYQIARTLQPHNQDTIQALADAYLKANRPDDAIAMLKKLPPGEGTAQIVDLQLKTGQLEAADQWITSLKGITPTTDILTATSKVRLEQGRVGEAINSAEQASKLDAAKPNVQLQLGLSYALGGKADQLGRLIPSVGSPATLQALKQAQTGKSPLAYALYASGLLHSSRSILASLSDPAATDQVLMGKIDLILAVNDTSYLKTAQTDLKKAVAIDPANLEAHQLLREAYLKQTNKAEADQQTNLIEQLQSGKI